MQEICILPSCECNNAERSRGSHSEDIIYQLSTSATNARYQDEHYKDYNLIDVNNNSIQNY